VGGTFVKVGFFKDEKLDYVEQIPTRTEDNGKWILDDIADAMKNILQMKQVNPEEVSGVGIGLPGPVTSDGRVLGCVNLGWGIMDMGALSEKFYDRPVYPLNDANAATLGEMWQAGDCKNMAFITLGTGVGGGMVADGRLICGATGGAGEIGHFPVESQETDMCSCGKRGCLEQYCSATGVVRLAKKYIQEYENTVLNNVAEISAKDVFDGAKAGDECCLKIVDRFGDYLAKGCAYIASATNPEMIIIGGGVSKAGTIIIEAIEKYFKDYAFKPCAGVKFEMAKLGNEAGMYGCAYYVKSMTE